MASEKSKQGFFHGSWAKIMARWLFWSKVRMIILGSFQVLWKSKSFKQMTKLEESNLFENVCTWECPRVLIFTIFKSDLLIHPPLSSTKGQYSRWQATDLRVIQLVERGLTELYYSLPTWSGDLTAPVFSLCLKVCLIWVCVILEVTWVKIALFSFSLCSVDMI